MYIHNLAIQNFRCFEKVEIELNYPGRQGTKARPVPKASENVNLFLGSNGSGKSSLFKAAVITVLGPILSDSGFQADYLIRRTKGETHRLGASIAPSTLHGEFRLSNPDYMNVASPAEGDTRWIHIDRIGDVEKIRGTAYLPTGAEPVSNLYIHNSPAYFLVGYGANRRTERPEGYSEQNRSPRYQRVAGLFEDHVGLAPFTYAYLEMQSLGYLNSAQQILNALLPDTVALTYILDSQRRPLFEQDGILLPFSALSDGFRAFVGWVWDLLYQMARVQSTGAELTDLPGVVIVDEIDLFLHPEWQRVVVQKVAEAFPNLQFLFSTHSPLVAGTLEPENLFVVERGPEGTATVAQYRENIHGLTANQVLTSSYFGLSSTRAPGTGTLDDLAQRETAPISLTEPVEPLPDDQKEMLERMMQRAKEREKALSGNGE